jgi:hypothetical protein
MMPTGGPMIRPGDTEWSLWFGMAFEPFFGGLFIAVTFAGRSADPAWKLWAGRAVIALFFWGFGSATAFVMFRELRRRGKWVPPGLTRRPRLAAAAYAAAMLLAASVVFSGSVVCLELIVSGST